MKPTILPLLLAVLLWLPLSLSAQDIPESSPEAIEAHARGLRAYLGQEYGVAMPHFLKANELDPTFLAPLLMGAINAGNGGFTAIRDSLWTMVFERQDQFSDYYNRLIDAYKAGAGEERLDLAEALMNDYPGTKVAYNYAYWAMGMNRPETAIRALRTLDPDREPMKGWHSYYGVLGNAYHALGDFDTEVELAREGFQRFPTRAAACGHLAEALASQGSMEALDETLELCENTIPVVRSWTQGAILSAVGRELLAHGNEAHAQSYLDRAVRWYEGLPPDEQATTRMRRQYAYALYSAGRYEDAQGLYAGLVEDFPNSIGDRSRLGSCAALAGDLDTARDALRAIEGGEFSSNPAVIHGWASFITAAMGDVEATYDHFEETWPGARWVHIEPSLVRVLSSEQRYWDYMRRPRQ